VFETKAELVELQRLLDASFERSGEQLRSVFNVSHRLTAGQLSGFQGVRLVAIATVNSSGEPRAAPRSAAFIHGKFFLAANTESVMVRRLSNKPALGVTYFENHLLIVGHGTATPFRRGSSGFEALRPEWEKAFRGGAHALDGVDILIRVDAANMLAFANRPEQYPKAWRTRAH
jgi:Pyridoxamine 5'-phosphate oxidase